MVSGGGAYVALMGIDGAGKTSLVAHLRQALEKSGLECVDTSKQPAIRSVRSNQGFPARSLERLWLELWRLLLGGGHADHVPADAAIPLQFTDQTRVASDWIEDALPDQVVGVRRSGPVACALTEFAIDQIIRAEIIGPVLNRGAVAINDNFGFKPTIKNICVAREISDDMVSDDALEQFESLLRVAYSLPFLQPDIGFLLDVDPRQAYQWRMHQDGRVGLNEDLWLAGQRGKDSFLTLQTTMAAMLREVASDWGWHVLTIDGRPQRETAAQAVELIMRDQRVRRLTEHGVAAT